LASTLVTRVSAAKKIFSESNIDLLFASIIRAKPKHRQKITMAGTNPSDSDRKGFDGMKRSIMLRSSVWTRLWVLKK